MSYKLSTKPNQTSFEFEQKKSVPRGKFRLVEVRLKEGKLTRTNFQSLEPGCPCLPRNTRQKYTSVVNTTAFAGVAAGGIGGILGNNVTGFLLNDVLAGAAQIVMGLSAGFPLSSAA